MTPAFINLEFKLSRRNKNKKKNKQKRQTYVYYTESPEQIKSIALKVFGSTYYSVSSLKDN